MEPEDTIDYNIRKTWYNITKLYNRTANEYMASMALGMIILNIDIIEGTPSTQLGPNMGMEATSLSRSLNKLEESGVIERKPDPNDKRRTVICLT
ncbi:MAG: MarR family transcriptional regulator, partial [Bacteroidota bacterium]|nr:MarR family transcriptional regulator [Bacteroidota bacterium]